jgi:hypothetical protein
MNSLHEIKAKLWGELGELYEAGCTAQEWLEEGAIPDPAPVGSDPAGRREVVRSASSKAAGT